MNSEMEGMCKERGLVSFKVLSRHFIGVTEKTTKTSVSAVDVPAKI
jgi:hypothetical protein